MTPTNQDHHQQHAPPPGPVVLQLVGADSEADNQAVATPWRYATTWKRDRGAAWR